MVFNYYRGNLMNKENYGNRIIDKKLKSQEFNNISLNSWFFLNNS